jgi:hypothetical protein
MATYRAVHGGGPGSGAVIGLTSAEVLPIQDGTVDGTYRRAYGLLTAAKTNTGIIFLRLHDSDPAVVDTGIVLYPGDAYEITNGNLYQRAIQGIATVAGSKLFIQIGS